MKRVVTNFYRMLMSLAVAIIMLGGMRAEVKAANDTIVIDFSKINPQTYKGKKLTSPDLDRISDFNLNEEEKNVVFLSSMVELYKIFKVENVTYKGDYLKGRIVVDANANQYIDITGTDKSQQLDAGSSKGTYEVIINDEYLKKKGNKECLMPYFAGKVMYGVDAKDSKGKWYYKLKIVFDNSDSNNDKGNGNNNGNNSKGNNNSKNNSKNKDDVTKVENFNPATDFEENGYLYRVVNDTEVSFLGISKALKTVNIPDTVTHQNKTYSVTAILDKALYNNKKVKRVTIGKNVKSIGTKAFAKCKKLKKVKIKSTSITTIGKKAFKKNADGFVIKAPKKCLKKYKKLLKKAGVTVGSVKNL